MNVSILGPQGSGKGTQIDLITKDFDFAVFESGSELRQVAKSDTEIGKEIKAILNLGDLIPDQHIYFLTKDWLANVPPEKNILFDGYPRRLTQAKDLESLLADRGQKIDLVISLKLSDEVAAKRLMGRLLCNDQEHIFNRQTNPPKSPGVCDFDGSLLVRREDETPETVKNRLSLFHQETEPIIGMFAKITRVVQVDADQPIVAVYEKIKGILSTMLSSKV